MATIIAYVTNDARKYWPQFFGFSSTAVPATGVIHSPNGFTTAATTVAALSAGDLFLHSSVIKRKVAIPTATGLDPTKSWVQTVLSGQVDQLLNATSVTRIRNWNLVPSITSFKIGEGGWVDNGAGKQARVPDPDLRFVASPPGDIQDLDCIVDPTRPSVDQRYPDGTRAVFEKQLLATDMVYEADYITKVTCNVLTTEFNDDGYGNSPEVWEIGLFSDHPTVLGEKLMVAYGTFPLQTKNNLTALSNIVRIAF